MVPEPVPGPARARRLNALGAVVVLVVLAGAGAAHDLATGTGLRRVFAVCFVLGCLVDALAAHRVDLKAVVVMPPLVYFAVAVVTTFAQHTSGSVLSQQAIGLANAVVLNAPVLLIGEAVAIVVAAFRALVLHR